MQIKEIIKSQRCFFKTNVTKSVTFRKKQLLKLKQLIEANETHLYKAIYADFKKSEFDTYTTEIQFIYHEINLALRNLNKWTRKKRVASNLVNFPSRSYVIAEPLGATLVIAPWNYPIQLSILPAIASITSGNTVVIKPSEITKNVSGLLAKIINENFDANYIHVIEGGVDISTQLLAQKWDKIFFTGSSAVGKIVYQAAAKNLTPIILELGGKSPTFILKDCNIKMTVKRLIWAKFLNAGQTCIAPDYLLVEDAIKDEFLAELLKEIQNQYPTNTIAENFTAIINDKHYNRLKGLLKNESVFYGGNFEDENRYVSPTIVYPVKEESQLMQNEIFGPILPLLTFTNLEETIHNLKEKDKPLACYVFSKNKQRIQYILDHFSFGGGTINDAVMHISNANLPFGGVGNSGFGNYHGKNGFLAFSHQKGILHKPFWFELPLKYFPYTNKKLKWIKKYLVSHAFLLQPFLLLFLNFLYR